MTEEISLLGDAARVIAIPRTDWLVLTQSPLTAPPLARALREAEKRGKVTVDEHGRGEVLISFEPFK